MKRLACWIGRHEWELRVSHGDKFKVCAGCGKVHAAPPASGPKGSPAVDRTDDSWTGYHGGV